MENILCTAIVFFLSEVDDLASASPITELSSPSLAERGYKAVVLLLIYLVAALLDEILITHRLEVQTERHSSTLLCTLICINLKK